MIIVTGPGRSGTSFLARVYRELGYDPGGRWLGEKNAGLEADDVVRLNHDIISGLGMRPLHPPLRVPKAVRTAGRGMLPTSLRGHVRTALRALPARPGSREPLADWSRLDDVVARHRDRIHELARRRQVVKDPRFCWSLAVWVAAGAPIEHVLVTSRDSASMVASHMTAGNVGRLTPSAARNGFAYATGLCVVALQDGRVPWDLVRFPDLLTQPEHLYQVMRFPDPVPRDRFLRAITAVKDDRLVHDWR